MNNTISVYELLGLIKEDKAPKKIEYQGNILEFDGEDYKFYTGADVLSEDSLVKYISVGNLKDKVEILEENKPIIESISIIGKDIHKLENLGIYNIIEDIEVKLNEVIEFLNRKENNDKH